MSDETTTTNPENEAPHAPPAVLEPPQRELSEKERELCAEVAHGAVAAYCRALGHNNVSDWAGSPDWQKEQARAWVRAAFDGDTTLVTTSRLDAVKARIAAGSIHAVASALRAE